MLLVVAGRGTEAFAFACFASVFFLLVFCLAWVPGILFCRLRFLCHCFCFSFC